MTGAVCAWFVDTPEAIAMLKPKGFNGFFIPEVGGISAVEAVLAATSPGDYNIISLARLFEIQDAATATVIVQHFSGDRRVFGFLIADEVNAGDGHDDVTRQAAQRAWYDGIKAINQDKKVLVNYRVCGFGFPDEGAVIATPGRAWDEVSVDCYGLVHGHSDAEAVAWAMAGWAAVRAKFQAGTSILPWMQGCGCSVDPDHGNNPSRIDWCWNRDISGRLWDQYSLVLNAGVMAESRACGFYGAWGTCPEEDISMKRTPALLEEGAAVIRRHAATFEGSIA